MKYFGFNTLTLLGLAVLHLSLACNKDDSPRPTPEMKILVPTEGNSWTYLNPNTAGQMVIDFDNDGWTHTSQVVRTFFWVEKAGTIHVGIKARVSGGSSTLKATFLNESSEVSVGSSTYGVTYIGTYSIPSPGYYFLDLSGVKKTGTVFAQVSDILLGGEATQNGVHFSNKDYFYWGRRGPSVHLSYQVPQQAGDIRWFYNEVTVPEGNDVVGSYYMANGFNQGYFGFQVNSASERRILFSVWSPYQTDDPSSIPAEYRVTLNRKGEETTINDFGNEGSGGQSYLEFMWSAGTTYRFLLKVEPAEGVENKTDYTAYFYAPEVGSWRLIASWRRPFTSTYAKGLYSFLENFNTNTGPLTRQAAYGNQWVCNTNQEWFELTSAKFTADATARDKARLDYAGGTCDNGNRFYLKNCGFFNENTEIDTYFTRNGGGTHPSIDFNLLP
jgi:hypothetical protein